LATKKQRMQYKARISEVGLGECVEFARLQ